MRQLQGECMQLYPRTMGGGRGLTGPPLGSGTRPTLTVKNPRWHRQEMQYLARAWNLELFQSIEAVG